MKSFSNLMEKVVSNENIDFSIGEASSGKLKDKRVCKIYCNREKYYDYYRNLAYTYIRHVKTPLEIYDGISRKQRKIIVPTFDEQVLSHMLMTVLSEYIEKSMYLYTYGGLPHRGITQGKDSIKRWLRKDKKGTKYFLKMDIKNFFGSVDLDRLMDFVKTKIHDEQFTRLLEEIVRCSPEGLALGYYPSHWLAHWYLQVLDYYIKQELGIDYYIRYVDDMVCWSDSKEKLHNTRIKIEQKLNELGLKLKENWVVRKFAYTGKDGRIHGQFVDFMGYRFYRDKIILRKKIMIKMTRKARKVGKKRRATYYDCVQALSALNWIEQCDIYDMYLKWIKPYVDLGEMEDYVSFYNKRRAKEAKEDEKIYGLRIPNGRGLAA